MSILSSILVGAFVGAVVGPIALILVFFLYYAIFVPGMFDDGLGFLFIFKVFPIGVVTGAVFGALIGFKLKDI